MTVAVSDIISRARLQLMDDTGIRWTDLELVAYINDAQREIVLYKPDAVTRNEDLSLAEGTKQALPEASIRLLTVVRNNTPTSKRSIRAVSRETLDRFKPYWHDVDATAEVEHFVFDEMDQQHFYVYPPSDGTGTVEILYTRHPDQVTDFDDLEVADAYANVVLDYVLYRAFAKDGSVASEAQRSLGHYQAFMNALTGKQQVDTGSSPRALPENPTPGV